MKKICNNIDFADSEYCSCEAKDGNLTVIIEAWDESIIRVQFIDVIQFSYKLGDVISGIFESVDEGIFLTEALRRCYSKVPTEFPYKHFMIQDIQDFPFFEVIATEIIVNKEKSIV